MILNPKVVSLLHAQVPESTPIELITDDEAAVLMHGYLQTITSEGYSTELSTCDAILTWAEMARLHNSLLKLALQGFLLVGWSHERQQPTFSLSSMGQSFLDTYTNKLN